MTTDGGGGPPSWSSHCGEDGGLHYRERGVQPQTPEEMVRDFDFQMVLDPGLGVTDIDYTAEHKLVVAQKVLQQANSHGLELAYANPRIYLYVKSCQPGVAPDGRNILEFYGNVMFFTNRGPKRFSHTFSLLDRNVVRLPSPEVQAEVPGAVAETRSFLDKILRRKK